MVWAIRAIGIPLASSLTIGKLWLIGLGGVQADCRRAGFVEELGNVCGFVSRPTGPVIERLHVANAVFFQIVGNFFDFIALAHEFFNRVKSQFSAAIT